MQLAFQVLNYYLHFLFPFEFLFLKTSFLETEITSFLEKGTEITKTELIVI
jgi:hypothetical protein